MTMTDREIKEAVASEHLKIEHLSEDCLKPTSYDARVGKWVQRAGEASEIDLETARSVEIRPGEFFLFTTRERFELPSDVSGHLGSRTHFAFRGLMLLCGQHMDPGFRGVLVLGGYNAGSQSIVIEYKDKICNIEFDRLARAVEKPVGEYPAHKRGELPRDVKDYMRTLGTRPLYDLGTTVGSLQSKLSDLTRDVGTLRTVTLYLMLPILGAIFAGTIVSVLAVALGK